MNDVYEVGEKVNPSLSPQHAAALAYIERGIAVFPCIVPGAKAPACEGGFKARTTDIGQVDAWWGEIPAAPKYHETP
ncbi:MAG TPA: bifunctional DNA primase/polymerase [Stellaceae bacterium]|jgi:hypothetical protein|nr:bifunctional DNA primase/polymerase [Stellaceae bacterium]